MVEISEIVDEESLRAWLEALPSETEADQAEVRRIAVTIAVRAAQRVMPLWWHGVSLNPVLKARDLGPLPILRSILVASVAAARPTKANKKAADIALNGAATGASFAYLRPGDHPSDLFEPVANAADSAASAAYAASGIGSTVSEACTAAIHAVKAAPTIEALARDCEYADMDPSLFRRSLWPGVNELSDVWKDVRSHLAQSGEAEAWAFWTDWYERILDPKGQEPNWGMLEEIALIPPETWDAGPDVALPVINAIWERYKSQPPPDLDIEIERQPKASKTEIQRVQTAVAENKQSIPPTIDALQQFIVLEIEKWQQNNFLNAEQPDLCRTQIGTYVMMSEALTRISALVPEEGAPSDADAEELVSLGKLYLEKLKALPRDKADEVIEKVWTTGGNVVDLSLVAVSTALLTQMGLPPQHGVIVASLAFGRKNVGQIISAAKDYLKSSTGGS